MVRATLLRLSHSRRPPPSAVRLPRGVPTTGNGGIRVRPVSALDFPTHFPGSARQGGGPGWVPRTTFQGVQRARGFSSDGEESWGGKIVSDAKAATTNALLKTFLTGKGFDQNLDGMTVTRVVDGEVEVEVEVTSKLMNPYKTLHGGATCTLIDWVGTLAVMSRDPTKAGVSVELNVSFLSAVPEGATVVAVGKLLKLGRHLAFTEVELRDKASGKIIATGRHTKAV